LPQIHQLLQHHQHHQPHPLGQLLQHHQHHQPHPLGQIHQIRVYMTILSTIEVAEPEAVVERYVTISSIIIYFKNVKKNENIFMIRHHH
jgi:hypothetical protein